MVLSVSLQFEWFTTSLCLSLRSPALHFWILLPIQLQSTTSRLHWIATGFHKGWYSMADPLQITSNWIAFGRVEDYNNLENVTATKSIKRLRIIQSRLWDDSVMHNHDFYIQTQMGRKKQELQDFFSESQFARKPKMSTALRIKFLAKCMNIKSNSISD